MEVRRILQNAVYLKQAADAAAAKRQKEYDSKNIGTFAMVILLLLLCLTATIICLLYILWLAYPPDPEPEQRSAKVAPDNNYD